MLFTPNRMIVATLLAIFTFSHAAQADRIHWTGAVDSDLFNESNWTAFSTGMPPAPGTIDPGVAVNHDLEIRGGPAAVVNEAGLSTFWCSVPTAAVR